MPLLHSKILNGLLELDIGVIEVCDVLLKTLILRDELLLLGRRGLKLFPGVRRGIVAREERGDHERRQHRRTDSHPPHRGIGPTTTAASAIARGASGRRVAVAAACTADVSELRPDSPGDRPWHGGRVRDRREHVDRIHSAFRLANSSRGRLLSLVLLAGQPQRAKILGYHHLRLAPRTLPLPPRCTRRHLQHVAALRAQQPRHTLLVGHRPNVAKHRRRKLRTAPEPLPGLLRKPAIQRLADRVGKVPAELRQSGHWLRCHLDHYVGRLAPKRPLPHQHLIDHHRQRILVDATVHHRLRSELLRGHVLLRTDHHRRRCQRVLLLQHRRVFDDLGDPEVTQIRSPERVEENVRRLHVAVHDPIGMYEVERRRHRRQPQLQRRWLHRLNPPFSIPQTPIRKRATRQKPHHQDGQPLVLADVQNRNDRRMRQRRHHPHLAAKPLQECRILDEIPPRHLQYDRAALTLVPGAVGHPHPALAKLRYHPVAARDSPADQRIIRGRRGFRHDAPTCSFWGGDTETVNYLAR